jgi:hypothetical protein
LWHKLKSKASDNEDVLNLIYSMQEYDPSAIPTLADIIASLQRIQTSQS